MKNGPSIADFQSVMQKLRSIPPEAWKVTVGRELDKRARSPYGRIWLQYEAPNWAVSVWPVFESTPMMISADRHWQDSVRHSITRLFESYGPYLWFEIRIDLDRSFEYGQAVREDSREYRVVSAFVESIAKQELESLRRQARLEAERLVASNKLVQEYRDKRQELRRRFWS